MVETNKPNFQCIALIKDGILSGGYYNDRSTSNDKERITYGFREYLESSLRCPNIGRGTIDVRSIDNYISSLNETSRNDITDTISKRLNISKEKVLLLIQLWKVYNTKDGYLPLPKHEGLLLDFIFDVYSREDILLYYCGNFNKTNYPNMIEGFSSIGNHDSDHRNLTITHAVIECRNERVYHKLWEHIVKLSDENATLKKQLSDLTKKVEMIDGNLLELLRSQ